MKRVVITGMGALTPLGNSVKEFWENIISGKSGAAPITKFDASKFKTQFACELKGYQGENYLPKAELRKYDPYVQYALIAADEALRDAEVKPEAINKRKAGVIWGTGYGGFSTFENQIMEFAKGDGSPRFNPFFITKTIPNMASGILSIKSVFKGVNFTTVSACATSNTAIMEAMNYIRLGKADLIIAGGSEAAVTPASIAGFSAMKALSANNSFPSSASRPFDQARDGFVMGEGAGALVLESYEHAMNRGARIYGEVAGAAMTSDAYHMTNTHPEGEGAFQAMEEALQDALITPEEVDYINMHATSTPAGDLSETKAVSRLFEGKNKNCVLSATKSMTGHLLGAAGAVEAIICLLAMRDNIVPATINTTSVDAEIPSDLPILLHEARKKEVSIAVSNTFGFGGHNAIVVFRKI